jgi:hypothetical protein
MEAEMELLFYFIPFYHLFTFMPSIRENYLSMQKLSNQKQALAGMACSPPSLYCLSMYPSIDANICIE